MAKEYPYVVVEKITIDVKGGLEAEVSLHNSEHHVLTSKVTYPWWCDDKPWQPQYKHVAMLMAHAEAEFNRQLDRG